MVMVYPDVWQVMCERCGNYLTSEDAYVSLFGATLCYDCLMEEDREAKLIRDSRSECEMCGESTTDEEGDINHHSVWMCFECLDEEDRERERLENEWE